VPPNRRLDLIAEPPTKRVWLADLGLAAKTLPLVIVSRQDLEAPRALVLYVQLTTQYRRSSYEVQGSPRRGDCLQYTARG
jgi:mRNA-degrading endonuclease toxin of MazEF toxin-antitoxin module